MIGMSGMSNNSSKNKSSKVSMMIMSSAYFSISFPTNTFDAVSGLDFAASNIIKGFGLR